MNCPLCASVNLYCFLRRLNVPVHQNLVYKSQAEATSVERGELDLRVCADCGFVFNAAFDPTKLSYGMDYDNNQTYSPFFERYVNALAEYLLTEKQLQNSIIVEVGCGNGSFIRRLVNAPGANNRGIGFDPSYNGPEIEDNGRLRFFRRYYNEDCQQMGADAVICRHVIEHVPDPPAMLTSLHRTLADQATAQTFFETPCVDWIIKNQALYDFFYEHCSYFTQASLAYALTRAGFSIHGIKHVFGGQYLWAEAFIDTSVIPDARPTKPDLRKYQDLGTQESLIIKRWRKELMNLAKKGPLAFWGAGAKGATMANLTDPEREYVTCVVDLNPSKQGGYIPGTGHPIISYHDLANNRIKNIILMNPNYSDEINAILREAQIEAKLINPTDWWTS